MNLRHLTDDTLDNETIKLAKDEREVLAKILHHLREVDRRRLFSKFNLSSLFDYAIKRMGYSEDQAARRISAMRLLKELPQIEVKIENGDLTLTHLVKAQAVFRQERNASVPRSTEDKLALLTQIERTSKREAESTLKQNALVAVSFGPKTVETALDQFSEPVKLKLKRLLDLKAGVIQGVDPLVGHLADLGLEKWDPLKKAERAVTRASRSIDGFQETSIAGIANEGRDNSAPAASAQVRAAPSTSGRDHIPAAIRHHVIWRDHGQCRICKSSRNLQVDHIIPVALGGASEPDNLRLVCRSCNQRAAIEAFGADKMGKFIDL